MTVAFILLLASAVAIYLSCEFFVNGIEWVGRKFSVSRNATGSILAAFGTALPESVVTFVAVVFGAGPAQKELGVGAAIGGPLVLATVAYAVVGLTFILSKGKQDQRLFSRTSTQRLISDQKWFMWVFVAKIVLGLVAFAIKPWLGVLFLIAYALYVRQEMQPADEAGDEHEELEPLKIRPGAGNPSTGWALLQTGGALVVIFLSSQLFVHQLEAVGPWLGMPPQIVALLLSPIATELPEILNAVIWVRQGKQSMALSNISGAMMIQATIPSALGIFFTPWMLGHALVWAAVVTMASILGLYILLKQNKLSGPRLSWFGLLYVVFAAGLYFIPF
ncbi:MAG: putative sodium/calcium exchanger protein [Herminiimonas sp.]|nr:putative sodium/calcium exchanger protein [Herminiimonas sp.]